MVHDPWNKLSNQRTTELSKAKNPFTASIHVVSRFSDNNVIRKIQNRVRIIIETFSQNCFASNSGMKNHFRFSLLFCEPDSSKCVLKKLYFVFYAPESIKLWFFSRKIKDCPKILTILSSYILDVLFWFHFSCYIFQINLILC